MKKFLFLAFLAIFLVGCSADIAEVSDENTEVPELDVEEIVEEEEEESLPEPESVDQESEGEEEVQEDESEEELDEE